MMLFTSGFFITLEGLDGSGKTTLTKRICEYIRSKGNTVVQTKEVGGTELGVELRAVLLSDLGQAASETTQALLISAARRDHVEKLIIPALANGNVVVSDRFTTSTRVYQSKAYDLDSIVNIGQCGVIPDMTLYLDINYDTHLDRVTTRGALDSMDAMDPDVFEARTNIMRHHYNLESGGIWIDANGTIEEVFNSIKKHLDFVFLE